MSDPVDPAELADRLPDRPLSTEFIDDLADELRWSVMVSPWETPDGEETTTMWFVHDNPPLGDDQDQTGRVLGLRLTEQGGWQGEVLREGVTHDWWLDVSDIWADAMGAEVQLENAVVEVDGELERLEFGADE